MILLWDMKKLGALRAKIDAIDLQLITLLAKRAELVKKVGEVKKENNINTKDTLREGSILQALEEKSKTLNLSFKFVKKVWKIIFEESIKIEK